MYDDLSLDFEAGKIHALLGKNGVGKTTLIRILMGFLRPAAGECRIFGEPAHAVRPITRERVGLLFERHLTYDFFSIVQAERFMSRFYSRWKPERYYALTDLLGLRPSHKIADMSEGQRSQVVLGLLLAQDPELLILDDYSMGLDAGYRRLFVDYLREYFKDGKHTVVLTSHVIQDMEGFVDEAVFLKRGGHVYRTCLNRFTTSFRCLRIRTAADSAALLRQRLEALACRREPLPEGLINVEAHREYCEVFSFLEREAAAAALYAAGVEVRAELLEPRPMTMEDAFVGYTGRS